MAPAVGSRSSASAEPLQNSTSKRARYRKQGVVNKKMTVQKPLLPDELSKKPDKLSFEVSKCKVTRQEKGTAFEGQLWSLEAIQSKIKGRTMMFGAQSTHDLVPNFNGSGKNGLICM